MKKQWTQALILMVLAGMASNAWAQQTISLFFDNNGAESGITSPGTTSFSFMGSNWSGGVVATEGSPPLYASGSFSYEVMGGNAMVTFDTPVSSARFFYVHGNGFAPGTATARTANGTIVDTGDSDQATSFGDPDHFIDLDEDLPISTIEFTGGVIDNFSFTVAETGPAPSFDLLEGAWQNLDTTGEGILFDFSPSLNLLFMAWFTFTLEAVPSADPPAVDIGFDGQRWMTALLTIDGDTASGPLRARQAGAFDMPPTGSESGQPVGTVSVQLLDCDLALVTYTIDSAGGVSNSFEIVPTELVINPGGFSCTPNNIP